MRIFPVVYVTSLVALNGRHASAEHGSWFVVYALWTWAERADFHRVQTYGAALSEGLALREMASPLHLDLL